MVSVEKKEFVRATVAGIARRYSVDERVAFALNSKNPKELMICACDDSPKVVAAVLENISAPEKVLTVVAARIIKSSGDDTAKFRHMADRIIAHPNTSEATRERLRGHFYDCEMFDMLRAPSFA